MSGAQHSGGTIFSVLTPAGRGAVAVVAVSGPQAVPSVESCFQAKNGKPLGAQPMGRIVYGRWGAVDGEDLIVCRRGEEHVEIHSHGGSQSAANVIDQLVVLGCREITWQEWLKGQSPCPLAVAAQIALAEATTFRTAAILLDQFHGALRREIEEIGAMLRSPDIYLAEEKLQGLLATSPLGMHLTQPWQVVIAGRPNVGKSSLVNALVGYRRAIVFDQPGTTRDVVTASTVVDGWPLLLSDTAGMHQTTDQLEAAGIGLARERLNSADLVIWVCDASIHPVESWQQVLDQEASELGNTLFAQQLLVLNKIDRVEKQFQVPTGVVGTSVVTGAGTEPLLEKIVTTLVSAVPPMGSPVPFTAAQVEVVGSALTACRQGDIPGAVALLAGLLARQTA